MLTIAGAGVVAVIRRFLPRAVVGMSVRPDRYTQVSFGFIHFWCNFSIIVRLLH
jgi:hypothetical protein